MMMRSVLFSSICFGVHGSSSSTAMDMDSTAADMGSSTGMDMESTDMGSSTGMDMESTGMDMESTGMGFDESCPNNKDCDSCQDNSACGWYESKVAAVGVAPKCGALADDSILNNAWDLVDTCAACSFQDCSGCAAGGCDWHIQGLTGLTWPKGGCKVAGTAPATTFAKAAECKEECETVQSCVSCKENPICEWFCKGDSCAKLDGGCYLMDSGPLTNSVIATCPDCEANTCSSCQEVNCDWYSGFLDDDCIVKGEKPALPGLTEVTVCTTSTGTAAQASLGLIALTALFL